MASINRFSTLWKLPTMKKPICYGLYAICWMQSAGVQVHIRCKTKAKQVANVPIFYVLSFHSMMAVCWSTRMQEHKNSYLSRVGLYSLTKYRKVGHLAQKSLQSSTVSWYNEEDLGLIHSCLLIWDPSSKWADTAVVDLHHKEVKAAKAWFQDDSRLFCVPNNCHLLPCSQKKQFSKHHYDTVASRTQRDRMQLRHQTCFSQNVIMWKEPSYDANLNVDYNAEMPGHVKWLQRCCWMWHNKCEIP